MSRQRPDRGQRFGIGEIFGRSADRIPADERQDLVRLRRGAAPCPFRAGQGNCIKNGGVCSLRLYSNEEGAARRVEGLEGHLRVTCPYRFHQSGDVFRWVGETLLGTSAPIAVREVGFLQSDTGSDVGRIDMVLATEGPEDTLEWCALEIQAVYFSGDEMGAEFRRVQEYEGAALPFPAGRRRPDYRSSGPKRLMPQLQIKVPTLRRWGKKMAVVVDRPFFDAIGNMAEIPHISNGDIAWFIVRLEEEAGRGLHRLVHDRVHVTTLEHATEGLTGGNPVSKEEFEERIRDKIDNGRSE